MKQRRPGLEIVKLLQQGVLPKDIKRLLSVNGSSVRYWAIKLGMPYFIKGRKLKSEERAIANKMRLDGKTYLEIGKTLGISRQRAHQYVMMPP